MPLAVERLAGTRFRRCRGTAGLRFARGAFAWRSVLLWLSGVGLWRRVDVTWRWESDSSCFNRRNFVLSRTLRREPDVFALVAESEDRPVPSNAADRGWRLDTMPERADVDVCPCTEWPPEPRDDRSTALLAWLEGAVKFRCSAAAGGFDAGPWCAG